MQLGVELSLVGSSDWSAVKSLSVPTLGENSLETDLR